MAVRPFDEIFRDFVTDGVPASGIHHPEKKDIRDSLNALVAGPFPDNRVIKLNNANEGTENAIVVSASVAIPTAVYQVLYILNVTQENTGPVTVSGAINRKLVTNTNEPVPAGYLNPGMAVLCIDTGSELRMLSYGDAEAIQEAAEAAASRAEAAAAGLNLPSIDFGDAGKALVVNEDGNGYKVEDLVPDGSVDDRKITTPEVPEEGIDASKIKLDFSGFFANAVVRLISDKFKDIVSARDFGASGLGNDYTTELQAFLNEMKPTGLKAWVPRGDYGLSSALVLDNQGIPGESPGFPLGKNGIYKRTSIVGDGAGETVFRLSGDIVGIHIQTGLGKAHHRGFSVVQSSSTERIGVGLLVDQSQALKFSDIEIKGCYNGITNRDSFSMNYDSIDLVENINGFFGENVTSGSHPNAINFNSVRFMANSRRGCYLINPTTCNFFGGSFEGNGGDGPETGGLTVFGASNEGAFGVNVIGVYFEKNIGDADIRITNSGSGDRMVLHRIKGCTFNRISSTEYTWYNVLVQRSFSGFQRVIISENAFQGFGSYIPDALRKYIHNEDTGAGEVSSVVMENNIYGSPLEAPD